MLLGDVLAQLDDETLAEDTLLSLGDLPLIAAAKAKAASNAETLGSYLVEEVGRFLAHADSEAWVNLMSAINRADQPGTECLRHILTRKSCGGHAVS